MNGEGSRAGEGAGAEDRAYLHAAAIRFAMPARDGSGRRIVEVVCAPTEHHGVDARVHATITAKTVRGGGGGGGGGTGHGLGVDDVVGLVDVHLAAAVEIELADDAAVGGVVLKADGDVLALNGDGRFSVRGGRNIWFPENALLRSSADELFEDDGR